MRSKLTLIVLGIMLLSVGAYATDWNGRVGVGARLGLSAPLMEGSDFAYYGQEIEPFMMGYVGGIDFRVGMSKKFVLNFGWQYIRSYDDSTATDNQSFTFNNQDFAFAKLTGKIWSVTGNYYFMSDSKFQPYLLFGLALEDWRAAEQDGVRSHRSKDIFGVTGIGFDLALKENLHFDIQGKFSYGLTEVSNTFPEGFYGPSTWSEWNDRPFRAHFEPTVGLTYYFGGGKDADGDGVGDKKDNCPNTPVGAKVDKFGCGIDSDGDGIFDGIDICANTPIGAKVNENGCPIDSDNDGIYDGLDMCDDTPENVKVDETGCPLDGDKDGVADYLDKCPETITGVVVDKNGCGIDSDGDGIFDGLDKCPDTYKGAEIDQFGCPYDADQDGIVDSLDNCLGTPVGVKVDSVGCPIAKKIVDKITLSNNVAFASGSAQLKDEATPVLMSIVESMKAYPETKIEISGFADASGPEDFNLTLSENRAGAVKQFLVDNGIAESRMKSIGYGENPDYFIGDNNTPEGKQLNRRVEIKSAE